MTLSQEKLEQLQKQFPKDMPAGAILALAERLPEGMPIEQIMGQMAGIAATLPLKTLPDGEICRQVIWELQEQADRKTRTQPGNPKKIVRDFYDSLLLEMRLMGASVPVLEKELFGKRFSAPVMTAALSHMGVSSGKKQNGGICSGGKGTESAALGRNV